jgi:LysR family transcriptional regulator, nod-box dependent transcriptional activator
MDLHLFDLNLLVALDALLTERNVTRAGNRLNLSQSAMSGALARLRHHFRDELLVPIGRQMMLTPVAEGLVEPVRDILLRVRGTLGSKPRFEPSTATRHLSLAVSDYVTEILMADVLRRARCEAPNITFELRPVGRRANEDLESGELDFLISPEGYVSTTQPTEVLFEDTFTCVVWAGNTSIGSSLTLDEYLNLGHVVVNVGGAEPPSNYDEQFLRRSNLRRRVEISVPTFSLAPQLVVGTDRATTITTRLAAKCADILPLKLLALPVAIPPMVEVLQWHKVHEYDPAHHWFRRLLKEVVQTLPTEPPVVRHGRARRAAPVRILDGKRRRSRRGEAVASRT